MSEATPRFHLPFLIPGQAQKELFHNEALTRVDLALHPTVEEGPLNGPPPIPAAGQCWILGPAPTGVWTGKPHQLAMWTEAGWRFVVPAVGMEVWNKAGALRMRWNGTEWSVGELVCTKLVVGGQQVVGERQPAVPSPSGGMVIDAEARAAIAALTAALMSHGLIE